MTIDRILSLVAIIVSFIAVPASGYLSYRYAIRGEKRREFNAVADMIRPKLREHISHLQQGIYPGGKDIEVSSSEYDMLIDVSAARKRDALKRLIDDYQCALSGGSTVTEYGDKTITDLQTAIAALDKLMPFVVRR